MDKNEKVEAWMKKHHIQVLCIPGECMCVKVQEDVQTQSEEKCTFLHILLLQTLVIALCHLVLVNQNTCSSTLGQVRTADPL